MVKIFFSTVIGLLLISATLLFSTSATAASIQVHSDRNPVSLNESFQLIYQSNGSVDDDPDFSPLEKYLDILNRSKSSNVSIINGKYSSSKTWTLTVMAKQQGKITLPPINFGSDQSLSYQLSVKPAVKNGNVNADFYTRLRVDQQQVYAQQQLVITQQLFSANNLSAYGLDELDFNGSDVISQQLGDEQQYKTRIGQRTYLVIERRYAVFPQSSGLLQISPVLAEARIGSASNSFFGTLCRSKVVRARSNALSVAVLPVPTNSGVNPWLPAKEFQLLEQWPEDPPRFVQGEPVTRTLSIKAEGLTSAQLPVLPDIAIDGLKQYPDQPLLNDITNDTGITGYRLEKVALIPTRPGTLTLPAIEIAWWNTETQQKQVARIPARTIQVVAAATSSSVDNSAPVEPKIPATVEPQKQPEVLPAPVPVEDSFGWKVLSVVLALGWLITGFAWFMRSRNKPPRKPEATPEADHKQLLKKLQAVCQQRDLAGVRQALLNWSEAWLDQAEVHSLQDVIEHLPAELGAEIKKLDAVLYGAKQQTIDCDLIASGIQRLAQQKLGKTKQQATELLEPLYKIG